MLFGCLFACLLVCLLPCLFVRFIASLLCLFVCLLVLFGQRGPSLMSGTRVASPKPAPKKQTSHGSLFQQNAHDKLQKSTLSNAGKRATNVSFKLPFSG